MDIRLEEAIKLLWLREEGWDERELAPINKYSINERDYRELVKKGYAEEKDGRWVLTDQGRHIGSEIIRRLRLAEWLFSEIIETDSRFSNEAACRLEHILTEEATERICILFGHPRVCPHGKPIPRGKCCGKQKTDLKPFLLPLYHLRENESAKIISINIDDRRIKHKMASFGLIPGVCVKIKKRRPVFLIEMDGSVFSVEEKIAEKIFVKRT